MEKKASFLWLVRHGESTGNIARCEADKNGAKTIELPAREPDIPLSVLGEEQARLAGSWFSEQTNRPEFVYSSPYLRTRETTRILMESAGFNPKIPLRFDERLRERELGVFDRLTRLGATEKYPDLNELRERWGKFYFRPPGGESWTDVIIRLRSFIATNLANHQNENLLIVTHEVVIRCFRYILEDLSEEEILAIDHAGDIKNGAITSFEYCPADNKFFLKLDNFLP